MMAVFVAGDLAASSTNIIVLGFGVVLPTLLVLGLYVQYFRRRRRGTDNGHNVTAFGTVVSEEQEGPLISVRVFQRARVANPKHEWVEFRREMISRPFSLLARGGEQLRVEPNDQFSFISNLDGFDSAATTDDERCRTALLLPGQEVYVSGARLRGNDAVFAGPYRDAKTTTVIGTARRRLLISREPLATAQRRCASAYSRCAIVTLAVFAIAHSTIFLSYHALQLAGRVINVQVQPTHKKPSDLSDLWPVFVVLPRGDTTQESGSSELYHDVEQGHLSSAPLLLAGPFHQLGTEPTQGFRKLMLFSLFAVAYVIGCLLYLRSKKSWWEGARVVDVGYGPPSVRTISSNTSIPPTDQ